MSRFLVVTWDGAGNLVATLGIARELAERGHDVRVLGHRSIDARCGAYGWRFQPFRHARDFDGTRPFDLSAEMAMLSRDFWFSPAVAADVREALNREAADVILADCMLLGALSAGQAAGVPTAALFHSPFSGFRVGPMVELLAPGLPALNALREELGLAPVTSIADVHDACAVSLVATPREFDVDIPLPANVRFIGPVRDAPPLTRQVHDLHIDDHPEPLVVVSFSTSYQDQLALLQRVVDALDALRVRVAVTTGPAIPAEALTAPANTVVAQFVPHDRLLPRAALVVTHAGLGTVLAALSHGVPLVCLPMGRDQFFNAAMVERLGAGRTVGMEAGADAIRAAVEGVLADPAVRDSATHMASVIAGYGGAADAVSELERRASRH